ncbi:hypothetical protein BGZ60DRAFT_124537 [Tricladium varicosporioides]|nr:hypothetical protein BGZ60DRAFT_124537 [Hymenoscyphus varicosporioides]
MQKKGRKAEDGTVIVIACTDPRCTPEEFMGMSPESGNTTIVRTAGGRVQPALSTLLVLSAVGNLGKKGTIIVVHHTDCGLASVRNDDEIRRILRAGLESGDGEEEILDKMMFGSIVDPDESVKEDVKWLRESIWFKGMSIVGLVQNTESGLLSEVICLGSERRQ